MKKVILFVFLFVLCALPVLAAETSDQIGGVSDPGLLPDSPFYFLKNWGRALSQVFTFDAVKKAELELKFVNEDALALKKLCEADKCELAEKLAQKFEERVAKVMDLAEKAKEKGKDVEALTEKLKENYTRQYENILRVMEKAPEAAQQGLTNALENSEAKLEGVVEKFQGAEKKNELREELNIRIQNTVKNMGEETQVRVREELKERFLEIEASPKKVSPTSQNKNSPQASPSPSASMSPKSNLDSSKSNSSSAASSPSPNAKK